MRETYADHESCLLSSVRASREIGAASEVMGARAMRAAMKAVLNFMVMFYRCGEDGSAQRSFCTKKELERSGTVITLPVPAYIWIVKSR